jgi:hypothetical protein
MDTNSSDEDNVDETSSVLSDVSEEHLDPADATLHGGQYMGCPDCNDAMTDVVSRELAVVPSSKCWLCTFSPHPIAISMHSFIVDNIACMDFKYIASQIKHEILATYPHAMVKIPC